MRYYLCLEIGGTNLRRAVVDEGFRLCRFEKSPTKPLSDAEDKTHFLVNLLNPLLDEYGRNNFICLTVSLASLMNRERTMCFSSPNIRGFDGIPLKQMLSDALQMPVILERDVNTSLLYEMRKCGRGTDGIVAGIFLGTGLGNAMAINGEIYIGSTGSSCELGHIPVPHLRENCGCGKAGCIELLASGAALAKLARDVYHCPVADIFRLHGQEDDVREIVYMSALATASEVSILDPAYLIIGGGVVDMAQFPMNDFQTIVLDNVRVPNPRASLTMVKASGDEYAGVIGAAIHAHNKLETLYSEESGNTCLK